MDILTAAPVLCKVTLEKNEDNFTRARVEASDGSRSPVTGFTHYRVMHNLIWSCDCSDYIIRRDSGERSPVCEHILAVQEVIAWAETPEPAPAPRTPAQDAADSLTAELTAGLSDKDAQAVAKRIASGYELHLAGKVSQYNTTWQNLTALGNWTCDCPDATHRALTSKRGTVCKHTAAGMIAQRIQQAQAVTTQREVAHRNERRARFATDPAPGDGGRLASDYETMKPTPAYQQMLDRQRARIEATQAGYDAAPKADPLNLAAPKNVNIQPRYGR